MYLLRVFILLVLLPASFISNIHAQQLNQLNLTCFTTDDGLPQNSVTDIIIADDGQLIVSTYLGVVAFDGSRFTDYIPLSDNQFPQKETYKLKTGDDGSLFLGTTTNGLYRFNKNNLKQWTVRDGLYNNNINDIVKTKEGIYIQNDELLFFVDNNNPYKLTSFDLPVNQPGVGFQIFALNKELIFSTSNENWRYHNNKWHQIFLKYDNELLTGNIYPSENNENIFFLERNNQLFIVEDFKVKLYLSKFLLDESELINSILLDSNKILWLTTENHGLIRYSNNQIETLNETKNLRTAPIIEDKDGVIWFGGSNGLCFLNQNMIRNIGAKQGLLKENIRYLSVNKDNTVFALNQDSQRKYYSINSSSINSNTIDSFHFTTNEMIYALIDDGDNIWIATEKRIAKLINGTIETLIMLNNKSRGLLSKNGTLWFTDGAYLISYADSKFKKFLIAENAEVYSMAFGLEGDVLLAEKSSAYKLLDGNITKIDLPLTFSSCIHEFIKDELWVCGDGLWLIKNGKTYYFDDNQGLTNGHVHDVINDEFNNLWIITNVGLFKILRSDINELKLDTNDSYNTKKLFFRYTEKDGMQSSEFNGSSNVAVKTSDDKLWFANQKGIVVVDPSFKDKSLKNEIKPFVEHLFIGNTRIAQDDFMTIQPNPQTIHFHFGAVFLTGSADLSYRYKLQNYHKDWQKGSSVDFSSLAPKNYTLIAQVKIKNHKWSKPLSVKFKILPAWYQTLFFRIISIFLAVIILIGLPSLRIQWLKRNADELRRLVNKQTASLTEANKRLKNLANKDELTGISNRREFIKQITLLCKNNACDVYLMLIDIDDFKAYNDFYGHIQGDECLKQVSHLLNVLSSNNCLVARYGGEEFVILFTQQKFTKVKEKCNQLLKNISKQAILHEKSSVKKIVSISAGLVACQENETIELFIERADKAMYEAKQAGKDRLIIK